MRIIISKVIKLFVILIVIVVGGLVISTAIPWKSGIRAYTVLSGSMEPTIKTGSIVIARETPAEKIKINEIVAFRDPEDVRRILVHRIVDVTQGEKDDRRLFFITKGDANTIADSTKISQALIIGRVDQAIPYLGYFLNFIRQPAGVAIFLIVPCLVIVLIELRNFHMHLELHYQKKHKKREDAELNTSFKRPMVLLFILLAELLVLKQGGLTAFSLFAASTVSSAQIITSGNWITSTPTPATAPLDIPNSGSVVINEVMWMGSTNSEHLSDDEWIELRNTTGNPIDLTGWKMDGAGLGSSSITLSGTILAHGFFLLGHYSFDHSAVNNAISADQIIPSISLANGGEQLTLKDTSDNIIDQTPVGAWAAGLNTSNKQSMGRDDDSTIGWYTCTDVACNDTTYWDNEGGNYGTPKAANLFGELRFNLHISGDGREAGFRVLNISNFKKLTYELTYDTDTISDGVSGNIDLNGEDEYIKDGITLGTCSAGGTCVYYSGVHNIKLKVDLEDSLGAVVTLEQTI